MAWELGFDGATLGVEVPGGLKPLLCLLKSKGALVGAAVATGCPNIGLVVEPGRDVTCGLATLLGTFDAGCDTCVPRAGIPATPGCLRALA